MSVIIGLLCRAREVYASATFTVPEQVNLSFAGCPPVWSGGPGEFPAAANSPVPGKPSATSYSTAVQTQEYSSAWLLGADEIRAGRNGGKYSSVGLSQLTLASEGPGAAYSPGMSAGVMP